MHHLEVKYALDLVKYPNFCEMRQRFSQTAYIFAAWNLWTIRCT